MCGGDEGYRTPYLPAASGALSQTDTYAHATEQMKRESAARMDAFYQSVKGG